MTVSLAEAMAAARRIQADAYPSQWTRRNDARLLAAFVLAGDTERLREALDAELERVKALPMPLRLPGNRLGYIRGIEFARKALAEGSP